MRAHDDKSTGLLPAALLAVVVALVGLAGAVKIARNAVVLGPAVGDIVWFEPHGYMPHDMQNQIAVERTNAAGCVLDLQAINRDGGSLVVEQRELGDGPARYQVHWSGRQSADGPADCGRQADLKLDDTNLDLLALAAGGWGVGKKHMAPSSLWGSADGRSRTQ